MKKYIAFLLCLTMLISLVSCRSNEDRDDLSQNDSTNNTPTQGSGAEMTMQMYEAAINDEICVFDERAGEAKLSSLRFTSNGLSLGECNLLKKAVSDIDGDGVAEYVIKSPDKKLIILRYYNGKVYSYRLDIYDFYNFNADGTFYWYDPSEEGGMECGLNRIIFYGESLITKPMYGVKHSCNPTKYEYFVEGEAVTEDEYYSYRTDNSRLEKMNFSYFEPTCSYPITADQAWNLANTYWDNQDGRSDGAVGSIFTARVELVDTPNPDAEYYRVAFLVERASNVMEWSECIPPRKVQLEDQILVNAFTGEITASTYDPDGKGVSVEEAIEIAKNHRTYTSGETCNEENGYRVVHTPDAPAPDHIYVIVIQKNDIQTDTIWIDKNTGEIVYPYYM